MARNIPDFNLAEAIHYLHRPPPGAPVDSMRDWQHPAQLRLALEELVAHHLSLQALRAEEKACPALAIKGDGSLIAPFLKALPFQPTGAQERVIGEILADMREPSPMLRLVQGDVGSGKTLVAAMACINAIESGHQIALMAPTELLAEQHLQTFGQWLTPLGIDVAWLSGKVKGRARDAVLQSIAAGSASLVIGTHALFQEGVVFASLALVIVDEQHRFGVHQRLALTEKSPGQTLPHQLVLTATPIPRTLSMVAYADLDCSVIDELPPGRTPVTTTLLDAQRRTDVIQRVGAACADGRQAYWVCTLIEESDNVDARAAEATFALLAGQLPGLSIGLIHGRLSAADKETVMADFKSGALQLPVSTTVIEVGVDVPNASLMIIENPERLGLAQLHQLRGRVGRGEAASTCLLLYQAPLSKSGQRRLEIMRETEDGFKIAETDLEMRGAGDLIEDETLHRDLRLEDLEQVPCDALSLAVFIGCEQHFGGILDQLLEMTDVGLLLRVEDVNGAKVVFDVDAKASPTRLLVLFWNVRTAARKVSDVANRRLHDIFRTEKCRDGTGFGGGLHYDDGLAHGPSG